MNWTSGHNRPQKWIDSGVKREESRYGEGSGQIGSWKLGGCGEIKLICVCICGHMRVLVRTGDV